MRRRGPSLIRVAAVAGTATAVSGHVKNKQEDKQDAKAAEQQAQAQPVAAPVAAAPAEDDQMAKLTELGELHAKGILTDEEFSAAKAKVLGI
ncbi:MAG: SHOCT domain-containing protein [Actinobacteria bacterium]|nr:SHOCT domain-containing protein [Actinomycetota bacterium]